MGKEMHIIVLMIVFVVISLIECNSIHKRQPIVNFTAEEEASEEVAVTGSAGEDSPRAIPDEVTNSTIVETHENTTDADISYQNNENQRVKRSRPSASRRPGKKGKSKETRSRRHQPQSTVIHVEAIHSEKIPSSSVGYDAEGRINGTWRSTVRQGDIRFDERRNAIKITRDGVYELYSSIRFAHNTSHGLTHCIGVVDKEGYLEEKLGCSYNAAIQDQDGMWENDSQGFAKGYFLLKAKTLIGVGIDTSGDKAPRTRAIVFVKDQCYFGARLN